MYLQQTMEIVIPLPVFYVGLLPLDALCKSELCFLPSVVLGNCMEKYKRGSSIWKYNPISRTFKLNNKLLQGLMVLEFLKPRIDYDNSKNYFKSSYFHFCSTHVWFFNIFICVFCALKFVMWFLSDFALWALIQTLNFKFMSKHDQFVLGDKHVLPCISSVIISDGWQCSYNEINLFKAVSMFEYKWY